MATKTIYSYHRCSINDEVTNNVPLRENFFASLKMHWLTAVQVSPRNPLCSKLFRSEVAIRNEKKRQMQSNCPFVIHPLSSFRFWYEMYLCILYLLVLLDKPISAGFEGITMERVFRGHHMCTMVLDGLCWIDIGMNFFTGYVLSSKRQVELRLNRIAKHYILSPFFICDVLSSFNKHTVHYLNMNKTTLNFVCGLISIFEILKIVRILTFITLTRRVAEHFKLRGITKVFVMNSLLAFILCVHWIASLGFIVPRLTTRFFVTESDETKAWIYNYGIYKKPFIKRYNHAFFKCSTYILGIHLTKLYVIQTDGDMMVAVLSIILGKILLACIWVLLALIILNNRSMDIKYQDLIKELEEYIKRKQLPTNLKEKLLHYYRYKFRGKYLREELVSNLLSDRLRNEVNMHVCKSLIKQVTIFSELTVDQINEVVSKLKKTIFLPSDPIYQSGTEGNSMYFIASGTVAVYSHSGKEICHLQDGGYFGELCIIMQGTIRITSVIAVETSQIYRLDKTSFEQILTKNKEVFRKLLFFAEFRFREVLESEFQYRKLMMENENAETDSKRSLRLRGLIRK